MKSATSSRLIFGEDERVGEWAKDARFTDSWGEFESLGYEVDGKIVAAVIYNDYKRYNISMHLSAKGRWMDKEFVRAAFSYPFDQLGVNRVTAFVAAKRADIERFYTLFGFEREGVMKCALENDDLVIMGMTRERCKWL